MSNDQSKSTPKKAEAAKPVPTDKTPAPSGGKTPPAKPAAPAAPLIPPLFRRVDWFAFGLTTLLALIGYCITLSPDLTLEDSGELAVGSFYAGVPHPPGYPVWTIYTWLFTVLFPVSNIAFRVSLSSAVAAAFSCGLLALIVSRGSSMMIEGIAELKAIEQRAESSLCIIAGCVAGLLLGFNGFMWSQAVIVEVYPFSVLSLMGVLCCLLRWIYAPSQMRYAYWASFLFGICFTNHQTLIVAAMGLEIAMCAAKPKLGRDLFLINTIFYFAGLVAKQKGIITSFDLNPALFAIYNAVGVGSLIAFTVLSFTTKSILSEWKPMVILALVWFLGAMFYFYMPLASMTNPPMNWGYPRTEEGFWHALTRGQYDKTNPTSDIGRLFDQIRMYVEGAIDEYNFVYLVIGLVPFLFYRKMQKRERAWIIGLSSIYICLAGLLLVLLNPSTDRQSREQARVFFTASYVIISIGIGYGITLIGSVLATQYATFRRPALWASAAATAIALYAFFDLKTSFFIDHLNAGMAIGFALVAVGIFWVSVERPPLKILFVLFALMPVHSILSHWADNEQHGHLFGYWFGHDMFTPPGKEYPPMARDAVLFGGTDPGRFCPTYMIFCESFIPPSKRRDPDFDRRDVYLITQNALADGTYLSYIRAHYNRSAQIDPPFFVNFLRSAREEEEGRTNLLARMSVPLDRVFTDLGAKIEARRRGEGVYPKTEILTPSVEDSSKAFQDYIVDAQRRLQHDMSHPNEPKQLKPGEDVKVIDNRISVSGQVAVMAINGLLTKIIWEKNPNHEFYVEESFPLDWMFPYLTPFGIIMKISHKEVGEFTEAMVKQDHDFWSQYSARFTGNWITYDTPVKDICAFAEKRYLRREFDGFTGDPKFIRDDNAQKAFSKLRSAIGGLYYWRLGQTRNPAENQRMVKEAEFAFKQSFAFCPYSPEAVFKYVNLLVNVGRLADAAAIVKTCLKFDPENPSIHSLEQNILDIQKGQSAALTAQTQVSAAEFQFRSSPTNLEKAFQLASMYLQLQKTNQANQIFQQLIDNPSADPRTLLSVAQAYVQTGNGPGLEAAMGRLVNLMPDNPEAWYDYSRSLMTVNKPAEALKALSKALELSRARLAKEPTAKDLTAEAVKDASFGGIRQMPEFLKIISQK